MNAFINEACRLVLSSQICDFIQPRPYFWWAPLLIVLLFVLHWLAEKIPALQLIKARILIPLATWLKFKYLQQAAIAADVASDVNIFVAQLRGELPSDWFPNMTIKWVREETRQSIFRDGLPVLRVRPVESQGGNFVKAVHAFFDKNLFPRSADLVPATLREAAVLEITRKLIHGRRPSLKRLLDDEVLEPAVRARREVLEYLDRYEKLDKRGYFTGSFLREVHTVATDAKYLPARNDLPKEIKAILSHNEKFMDGYIRSKDKLNPDRTIIPSEMWSRKGAVTNYAFLLVAAPHNAKSQEIHVFVKKARERASEGVDRLYVFGTRQEKSFARSVIRAIARNVPDYELKETFKSESDYRGEKGGLGAIFVRQR